MPRMLKNMLEIEGDVLYFTLVYDPETSVARVHLKHNKILASRFVAEIHIPSHRWPHEPLEL
jgi:hypothetical protein